MAEKRADAAAGGGGGGGAGCQEVTVSACSEPS